MSFHIHSSLSKSFKEILQINRCPLSTVTRFMEPQIEPMQQNTVRPFRVSIEGNIGAGKSTLIKYFSKFPEVDAHMEPVSEWCNVQGHNLLDLLYKDIKRCNFMFQNYIQLSRINTQMYQTNKRVHMFERSLQNNRFCFVEMAHKSKKLTDPEYTVLCKWYNWIEQNVDIRLDLIVYLQTTPELCYKRIQQRKRPEESTVSLDYLREVHTTYEHWLLHSEIQSPVLVIDGKKELDEVRQLYVKNQQCILGQNKMNSKTVTQEPVEKVAIV